jgi:hypothetical protein
MIKNLPDISKPDGLVEYLLKRLGLSKSNINSKITYNDVLQGQVISATQIDWKQCIGHSFYGKEKSPDAGHQVFIRHKLLFFDIRERIGNEEFLKEFHVIFAVNYDHIKDSNIIHMADSRSFSDPKNFKGNRWVHESFQWEEQYGCEGKVPSTRIYPRCLAYLIINIVRTKSMPMYKFPPIDRDSKIHPSGIFHFHTRFEEIGNRKEIRDKMYDYHLQIDDLTDKMKDLENDIVTINNNKWNK